MQIVPIFLLLAAMAAAQQPSITNANLRTVAATGGLEAAVRTVSSSQQTPFWIGYAVPAIAGRNESCCWNNNDRGCALEHRRGGAFAPPAGPVMLEGPTHVAVLLRVTEGTVAKISTYSIDCPLDAGGLPFVWLTGVAPSDSITLLSKNATEGAVHAIAMHGAPQADAVLTQYANSGATEKIRKAAIFWLGNSRGNAGFQVVNRILRDDADERIREHATFAVFQSREKEAASALIAAAKGDRSPRVRGQALFWLAQKASRQDAGTIAAAIDNDPETEVKKKAVFALTQIPNSEGIPMLIHVARNNANAAVRKQAMFWLGQSKDSRAVKFFEEVLAK